MDLDALSWGTCTRCRGSGCTILGCVHPVSWIRMHYPGVRTPATVKILTVGRSHDPRSSPGFRANRHESQLAAIGHKGQISEIRARASVVGRPPNCQNFDSWHCPKRADAEVKVTKMSVNRSCEKLVLHVKRILNARPTPYFPDSSTGNVILLLLSVFTSANA